MKELNVYTREEMLEELKNDDNLQVFVGYYHTHPKFKGQERTINGSYQALKGWAASNSTEHLNEFYRVKCGFASKFIYEEKSNDFWG